MTHATFTVHFQTVMGENLFMELRRGAGRSDGVLAKDAGGRPIELGRWLPMVHVGGGYWTFALPVEPGAVAVCYRYVFVGRDGEVRREPAFREVKIVGGDHRVWDYWLPAELSEGALLRQAFAGVIFQPDRGLKVEAKLAGGAVVRLTMRCPRVPRGHCLCVSGAHPSLGRWNPTKAWVMSGERYPYWEVELPRAVFATAAEFKFGFWTAEAGKLVAFESGPNRILGPLPQDDTVEVVVNMEVYAHARPWKGAGVAIPVFALRSARGYGVGEFADLADLAEWAAGCGMRLVQVLPVNDTSSDFTWRDSYPYKAISTAALHPIYLNVEAAYQEHGQAVPGGYEPKRGVLNGLSGLDYETVLRDKMDWLRGLYDVVGDRVCAGEAVRTFLREQGDWLKPYAAFCVLRDRHGTADFSKWGDLAAYDAERIARWFDPGAPEHGEVMFPVFVQWHLKRQWDRAVEVGHAAGVAFKGDLPIGIDRWSVEAWSEPSLFHMDRQTGAPPDPFSALGQNWGFPTYDWPRMAADGYAWWQRRFQRMSACFDAMRIDHILGFFRIWEIPVPHREGILGHFNPTRPLTREEIRGAGFGRVVESFAVATVPEGLLGSFFGESAGEAEEWLRHDSDGFVRFRGDFEKAEDRQVWVERFGAGEEGRRRGEAMVRFSHEVLFLEDPDQPGRYHPRIGLTGTAAFGALDPSEQAALRRLHDDYYYRRHTWFWEHEAMRKLPVLMDASAMLICGEDLGMIPDSVPVVLRRLGLLSLEVQSMPKRLGQRFGNPADYPYLSVCTTSTHDTPTLRGLWEEDAVLREEFHREVMGGAGEVPSECTPEIAHFIVQQNLRAASMWCVLPMQDWLALDGGLRRPKACEERINIPAIPRHYWRYRMHVPLERLREARDFNESVGRLIGESGRAGER